MLRWLWLWRWLCFGGAGVGKATAGDGGPSGDAERSADPVEVAARRLWQVEVDGRRAVLARAGVTSAVVGDDGVRALRLLRTRRVA